MPRTATLTDVLAGALILRSGVPLDHHAFRGRNGTSLPAWMRADVNSDHFQRVAESAQDFASWSLFDIMREAMKSVRGHVPADRGELINRGFSTSEVGVIFTTNVAAQLLSSYSDATDTTKPWTHSVDVPNFQTNERVAMSGFNGLTRHGRGGTADHVTNSATKEEYKIARYSGLFICDEMDILDDRLGGLEDETPADMGRSAAQLRPDLVYSILLGNPDLQDAVALFHADHNNLAGVALSATALEAAVTSFASQRINGRPLNIRPRYLVVPPNLIFLATQILSSLERRESGSENGTINALYGLGIEPISDVRVSTSGVIDPNTGVSYAGSSTNWFLSGRPGENGVKTIEVGYLNGTGQAPRIRQSNLTNGQFGWAWDVTMDIGAKALDSRALYKSTGG